MNKALTAALAIVAVVGFSGMTAAQTAATVNPSGGDTVDGGSTSNANLTADRNTNEWAGFYGNLSQTVQLSDGGTFYEWTASDVDGAAILAANANNAFTGDESNLAQPSDVNALNEVPSNGAEAASNTFNEAVGQPQDLNAVDTDSTTVDFDQADAFTNYLYNSTADNGNNPVFAAEANQDATAYNGETVDYQLLVGETSNTGTSQTFDFYAKIE